jgi:hypothetical protein
LAARTIGAGQRQGGKLEGNPPLVVGLLINGVAYAATFIVVAVLLSRFASEIIWRSFLVLFLFIAAGPT